MLHRRYLPPLGNRIIKTAVAVYICLLLHALSGYRSNVSQSAIAAIVCIQPYLTDSKTFAINRIRATLLGTGWGFAYLLLLRSVPVLGRYMALAYTVMAFFVLLSLYSTVVCKMTTSSSLVAVVYLGMVITYPQVDSSLVDTLWRMADTVVGTLVAIGVNVIHAPREKHPEKLFFLRTADLTPHRRPFPSSVHTALERLCGDGATISLITRHTPASLMPRIGTLSPSAPAIVLDGAALYDIQENRYLETVNLSGELLEKLCPLVENFGSSCCLYVIRDNSLCLFHSGPLSESEKAEQRWLRRSAYLHFPEGERRSGDAAVCLRLTDRAARIAELHELLRQVLPEGSVRMERRQEADFPEEAGLYLYAPGATVEAMEEQVRLRMEAERGMEMEAVEMIPRLNHYHPEQDALLLLGRLRNSYEPVRLFRRRAKK